VAKARLLAHSQKKEKIMHVYVASLKIMFEQNADPVQAAPMKKYMRDQFEYLGIKTPQNAALQKAFYKEYGLPELSELDPILRELWLLPEREFQYIGMGLLGKFEKQLPDKFIDTVEYLIVTKSWWDTVDALASHTVGTHFGRFPKIRESHLKKWRKSKNIWVRRTTLLFQLGYKRETDFSLLREIIRENLGSDEFFINKAIGWSLRQYAYIDPNAVKKFVQSTPLHPLSRREAMKHLEI
jgi:3-methyladenine DNA glycosylase AlkD